MKSTAKAEALLRDVADKLKVRFAGSATIDTVRAAKDSNGWPMLICSDGGVETAGAAVIAIRIQGIDMVSKDIFGGATSAYAPHVLDLAYEQTAANNPIPTDADLAVAAYEAQKTAVRYQQKSIANGTAVAQASMDAAAAICDLEDAYWPTKGV